MKSPIRLERRLEQPRWLNWAIPVISLLGALVVGARTRIMAAFEPAVAAEEYAEHSDFVFLVPSMLAMIADWWRANGRPPLGALRVMLSSGAPGPLSLLEEAFDVFPNASITEAYGAHSSSTWASA